MSQFVRRMHFKTYDLGTKATLILTFDSEKIPGLYEKVYPTAYKVTEFGAKGGYTFRATYKSQLGFTRAQISSIDNAIEPASTYVPINVGQKTSLTKDGNTYSFTTPTDLTPGDHIAAQNNTTGKENIGFGFFVRLPDDPPSTILLFKDVSCAYSVQIQFIPILRGYIIIDYQGNENNVVKTRVSSPVLFEVNLTQLEEETSWKITYNSGSGSFKINKDERD
jgi:hypothetical protein